VTLIFTFIDAAHGGAILGKVQNHFNRVRFGNPAVDFIAGSRRFVSGRDQFLGEAMLVWLRRFSRNPDVEKARTQFARAKKVQDDPVDRQPFLDVFAKKD
jgi:hypothetical protein